MRRLFQNVAAFYGTIGVPLVYVLGLWMVAKPNTANFVDSFRVLSLGLAFVGMIVWMASYLSLGKYFGVLPAVHERTQRGLYKYLKHPMYVGIMMTYLGLAVANQSRSGVVFTLFILGPLLMIRAALEERKLL